MVLGRIREESENLEEIDFVLRKNNTPLPKLGNLSIVVDVNVHDLILKLDVICGFGSATQLEAAVAGKRVITSYFDKALRPEYAAFIQFKNEFHVCSPFHNPFRRFVFSRCLSIKTDLPGNYRIAADT